MSHAATRIVLWTQRNAELTHAQSLESEIGRLEERLNQMKEMVAECNRKADAFKVAAEELAKLDGDG